MFDSLNDVDWASLIAPSLPMGGGIGWDVVAVTTAIGVLFPEAFRKNWMLWLIAVGGGHAILPMVGQISVLYIVPLIELFITLPEALVQMVKTIAVGIGCWLLWKFLSEVWEGTRDSDIETFTGVTVGSWWACTADAAYSGAVKASQAESYGWNFAEVIASNIIAAGVVMGMCITAIMVVLTFRESVRKPWLQLVAFYGEFSILGYFLMFFALGRARGLAEYMGYDLSGLPLELTAAIIAVGFVTVLFARNKDDILQAQAERLQVATA